MTGGRSAHLVDEQVGLPSDRRPVFVLAAPRSFSTVSTAVLGGHPQIFGFPELLLFTAPTLGEVLSQSGTMWEGWWKESNRWTQEVTAGWSARRTSGIYRAVAQLHEGNQKPAAIAQARAWVAGHAEWPGKRLMDHLLDLIHPRIGLEKSPDTLAEDGALQRCLDAYPAARLLHLTRHPVTTQASMRRHWRPRYAQRSNLSLTVAAASAWYQSNRLALLTLQRLPRDRWFRVRAEDLLREPLTWLPRILSWLDLDCDEHIIRAMLNTDQWAFAGSGQDGSLFGGDHKFFSSPKLRPVPAPGPVDFDPALGLPGPMRARMSELASCLGY
jgi:Sulfotransferase family